MEKTIHEWQSATALCALLGISRQRLIGMAKRHDDGDTMPRDGDPEGVVEFKLPPTFGKGKSNARTVYRIRPEERRRERPVGYWLAQWPGLVTVYHGEMRSSVATFWAHPPIGQRTCGDAQAGAVELARRFCAMMNGEAGQ